MKLLRLLVLLAALGLPGPLAAHTRLASSSPADGDTVGAAVQRIGIRFTRPVEAELTTITVIAGGDTVAGGQAGLVAGSEGKEFFLALAGELRPGGYTVAWRTSGADGHIIRGTFAFVVRPPASAGPVAPLPAEPASPPGPDLVEESSSDSAGAVLLRWAGYLALLGMVGAVGFELGVLAPLRRVHAHELAASRAAYGAWFLAAGAAALSVGILVARLWMQSAMAFGAAEALDAGRLSGLLQNTVWGIAWVLQAVATSAFFMGLLVARAPHGRTIGWIGAAVSAVLLCAVPALSGHAAAVERLTGVAILTDAVHVLGAGLWLGTLAVLVSAGLPAALWARDGGGTAAFAAMVNRFSPLALASAGVVGATGVVNALFHVTAVPQLWTTSYGQFLLGKLGLLAIVAAAGFYNWRRVRPILGDEAGALHLRRSARVELLVGGAAVLVTAILVALPTPG
ncbi:MAG: copper resistance protein CopC/CopD [Gemmatimonadetes bacterium]|nr:copper resistance protein CopC/CopD [Gemmatimonadota bacterium]